MYDALSMYRPSEIILPEGTILPQDIRDFIENQFSNVVFSPFSTYYTQREVSEKAVTHFGDLGPMEEGRMGKL